MVFQDEEVGKFINENFVSIRINAAVGDGVEWRKTHEIRGFPTVLFLKSDGSEIDRICGFDGGKDVYYKQIKNYVEGKNTYASLIEKYANTPDDAELNYLLGKKHFDRWEGEKAKPYFENVLNLDPKDKLGFQLEAKFGVAYVDARADGNIEALENIIATCDKPDLLEMGYERIIRFYMIKKDQKSVLQNFEAAVTRLPGNLFMKEQFASFVFNDKIENKYKRIAGMANEMLKQDGEEVLSGYTILGKFYEVQNDMEKYAANFEKALEKYPENTSLLNSYSWGIYKNKLAGKYELGIKLAKKATELKPDAAHIWDTLAWLYYANDEFKEALKTMEKAAALRPDSQAFQKNLKKMRKLTNGKQAS